MINQGKTKAASSAAAPERMLCPLSSRTHLHFLGTGDPLLNSINAELEVHTHPLPD